MRFAIKTAPQETTYQAMLDVWQVADELPVFESAWTFDHFEPIFSDRTGPCLEGWLTTTALAQATSRIRVGVLVTGMPYRHPSVLANMAATLDVISDGRLELGLGAGWNQDEADALGIPLPPLKERFDRFDEGVEVVRLLLSQEVSDFDGTYFNLRQARCEPKPVQRPHPPIVIGGSGPNRTLRSVARFADHWNHPGASVDGWRASLEVLHQRCAEIDRDPSTITTSTHVRCDWTEPNAVADECARWADAGMDLAILYLPQPHTPEHLPAVAEALAPLATGT
jgi:F420-dependent oxidoreductase-like protein